VFFGGFHAKNLDFDSKLHLKIHFWTSYGLLKQCDIITEEQRKELHKRKQ